MTTEETPGSNLAPTRDDAQPSLSTWAEALAPLTISDPRAGMETSPI